MNLEALAELVPDPEGFRSAPPTRPQVWSMPPRSAAARLTLSDLDRVASEQVLQAGDALRIFRVGETMPMAEYTWGEDALDRGFDTTVRPSSIAQALRRGYSVLFDALHRTSRPVGRQCRRLSDELGVPVMAGAFVTPPDSQGFSHHYDALSLFVVQAVGTKRWQIYDPILVDPLPHQLWNADELTDAERERFESGEPTQEVTLTPGDVLWLPRGWIHRAFANVEPSVHVSVALRSFTPYWMARQLLGSLDSLESLRRELPWGVSRDDDRLAEAIGGLIGELTEALAGVEVASLVPKIQKKIRRGIVEEGDDPVSSGMRRA